MIRLQGAASPSGTIGERTRCLKGDLHIHLLPLPQHFPTGGQDQALPVSESPGGGVRNGRFRENLGLVRALPHSLLNFLGPQRAVGRPLQHIALPVVALGK